MTLQRPIKSVLQEGTFDAAVARGWSRVQRKRAVRETARKSVLAVSCLLLAAATGWAVRPLFPATLPAPAPAPAPPPALAVEVKPAPQKLAPLDAIVEQLPRVHARTVSHQRPVPAPAPAEPVAPAAKSDVDVVGALLDSVRDAYDAGNVGRAAALLQEIADKHSEDPRAAQSLYVLGLIQLERDKDAEKAAESFTHALELSPPPDLVLTLWQALERARAAQH